MKSDELRAAGLPFILRATGFHDGTTLPASVVLNIQVTLIG